MTQHRILLQKSEQAGRQYNQDRFAVFQADDSNDLLIVVADGVGGTADGALAAQIIVDQSSICWQQRSSYSDGESLLTDLAGLSNRAIKQQTEQGINSAATLVALLVFNNQLISAHAGDSRLYQFNQQGIGSHTKDHSLAYAKFMMGEISEDDLATHPTQNQLLNCLDGSEDMQCDIASLKIDNGHYFVLCTDGFWEFFKQDEIVQLIENDNREFMFINRLDEQLQAHPKHDNTTVVICELDTTALTTDTDTDSVDVSSAGAVVIPKVTKVQEHLNRSSTSHVIERKSVSNKGWWLLLCAVLIIIVAFYSIQSYTLMPPQPLIYSDHIKYPDATANESSGGQSFISEQQSASKAIIVSDASEGNSSNKTLNDNLQSGPMLELDVPTGENAISKLEQHLANNGDISVGSKLDKTGMLVDQYGEITTVQLTIKNVPVFGAILRYKKTPAGIKVISGKVSNLSNVADSPTLEFSSCFSRYQQAQLLLGKTITPVKSEATLYIDAASSGYFWLTDILIKEDGSSFELSLLDVTCDALRLISNRVSG